MAEPISLASGLLTIALFALKTSLVLHETIKSFQNHPKQVRDLEEELEALTGVLKSLSEIDSSTSSVNLSALKLPLLRCATACDAFTKELVQFTKRSDKDRRSFREWAKLKYMGEDINAFNQQLAGYKATITIALTDVSIRNSAVTTKDLQKYQRMIKAATDDLEDRLQHIDEKLDTMLVQAVDESGTEGYEIKTIREERISTQQSLGICANLADYIAKIEKQSRKHGKETGNSSDAAPLPQRAIDEGLQGCKDSLAIASAKLEKHMSQLTQRLVARSKRPDSVDDRATDLARLQEEWETTRHCIEVCSQAEQHLNSNVSIIDNYAAGDETVQLLTSTDGTIFHGKNRGYGWKIRQVGGHMSDASLQQISQDIARISAPSATGNDHASPSGSNFGSDNTTSGADKDFDEKFGQGFKLTPETRALQEPTRKSPASHFLKKQ